MQRIEAAESLDPVADRLAPIAAPIIRPNRLRGLLRGDWLGHSAHPMLTDLPLGAWTCTSLLDVFGGRGSRPAAEGLLAFGLAAATPTVLTGAAEWLATSGQRRRVGLLHATVNLAAFGLYGASLGARRRNRHGVGVGLGLLGGLTATAGGYLGAHLTVARNVGTRDPAFDGTRLSDHH
jgi:uncharacterized membrane protein